MGKPIKINLFRARQLLTQAVDTQGEDFVYNPSGSTRGCYYTPQTKEEQERENDARESVKITGCLIGTALTLAGVDPEVLKDRGGTVADLAAGSYMRQHFLLSIEAATYFNVAQRAQDSGSTWGQARRAAEGYYEALHLKNYSKLLLKEEVSFD